MVGNSLRTAIAYLRRDSCLGCQNNLGPLCASCRRTLSLTSPTCSCGEFPIAAAATYEPPISNAIIGFKDRGQWTLRRELSQVLARSVAHLCLSTSCDPVGTGQPVTLVPVAAAAQAIRERNGDPIAELAKGAARILRSAGLNATVTQLLNMKRPHHDNVGLSRAQRLANMADAFAVSNVPAMATAIVLVDDVVTTGATLSAARSALVNVGLEVEGAAVLAAAKCR